MSISPVKWNSCSVNTTGPTLAWHAACLVLPIEIANHHKINIYKLPEEKIGRRTVVKVIYNFF